MKSRLVKRIFAVAMMAILFGNNVLPSVAETVSGGDAVIETGTEDKEDDTQETVNPDTTTETEEKSESSVKDDAGEADEEITDETTVSGGDAEELEEEELLEDEMMVLDPVTVDGVTITVSGSKEAFKEGTTVFAKAVEPAEVVIEAAEENEKAVVKKYKAFDISLMLDGKEVQPLNGEEIKVNFEGDMLIPDADNNEGVAVYHVDGEDNLTKMDAEVAPLTIENETVATETVEMTTTHFSTYVIIITGEEGECTVTYKHLLDGKEFYKPSEETVRQNVTRTYTDLAKAGVTAGGTDYRLTKIKVILADGKEETVDLDASDFGEKEIKIKSDATIELQYEPIEKTERYENGVIFYDYSVTFRGSFEIGQGETIKVGNTNYTVSNINTEYIDLKDGKGNVLTVRKGETIENVSVDGEQYASVTYAWWGGFNYCAAGEDINNAMTSENASRYLIMGWEGNRPAGAASLNISGTHGGDANQFNGGTSDKAIVQGIVAGLTGDLKNVVWGKNSNGEQIVEPGYFTMDPVEGKEIYENDFKLTFDQTGNKYQLYSAASSQYGETYSRCKSAETYDAHNYAAGDVSGQFFPLDKVPSAQFISDPRYVDHNWYFGMRYDFTFKLGDYIGDLLYTFNGDDDLWVFVDGELVLDLGGIHSTYPNRYNGTQISNTVDLWENYFGVTDRASDNWWEKANSKYDPEHEYQVTVLYMERGAFASSCYMEFVLPNVESRKINENYGNLSFHKTDSKTNQAVEGAVFTLYNSEGAKVKEAVSNSNGVVTFSGLTAGNYTMRETIAPEGYQETDKEWKVVVSEATSDDKTVVNAVLYDGDVAITQITNDPFRTQLIDITFKKVFRYDHNIVLSGAEFTLKENDINGKVIATAVSGEDGKFTFTGLEKGIYFLEETKAPEGYRTPEAGTGLTITVYEEDEKLNYKITSNNSGQLFYMKAGEENLVKNVKGIDVTITKEWKDARGNKIEETPVDKIEVELRRSFYEVKKNDDGTTTTATRDDQLVKNITLTKANNWTVTLKDLDYQCDGGVWNYYVVEKTEIAGYTPEYSAAVVNTKVEGAYSIGLTVTNVEESGSLTITKKVDRVDTVHGDATFTFKISLLDDKNETKEVFYRTITFREAGEKTIMVTGIPTGNYKVEELTTLRYTMEASSENGVVKKVTTESTPNYRFSNTKTNDERYSHTDVLVNSFRMDEDGTVTISKDRQVTEETKMNAEN